MRRRSRAQERPASPSGTGDGLVHAALGIKHRSRIDVFFEIAVLAPVWDDQGDGFRHLTTKVAAVGFGF